MERSTHPFEFEMDCTIHNGIYKKTKTEWTEKQLAKEYDYSIIGDKKLKDIKKIEKKDKKKELINFLSLSYIKY